MIFELQDLAALGLLVLLEGVLSIDNALVLAIIARRLPEHQRQRALNYGIIGAVVLRLAALAAVAVLWAVAIKQKESPQNIFATLGPGIERPYTVPVEYYNLPPGLSLGPDRMTRVRIRLKAEADLLNFIDSGRCRIKINLSGARDGPLDHVISTRDIDLPARIRLVGAEPSEIRLRLGKKTNTSASRP